MLMPTALAAPKIHSAEIIDRSELARDVVLIGLHAPDLVRVTKPGQFVLAIPPSGERAATALGIYEAQGERASLMFFVCGPRTRELSDLAVGESLDLAGPLGNGFDLSLKPRNVAIVAGGVGIASVFLPAQAALNSGARVHLFYGARTASLLVDAQKFEREGCVLHCATDDGSFGFEGYVPDLLAQSTEKFDVILACGPSPMLRATGRIAQRMGVSAQLSLEETFACGVGACWGCVVPVTRSSAQAPLFPMLSTDGARSDFVYARVCKEGPVFWAHDLRW